MLNTETAKVMSLPNPFDLRSYLLLVASDDGGDGGDGSDEDKGGADDKGGDDKGDKGGSSSGGTTETEEDKDKDDKSEAKLRSDEAAKYRNERNAERERAKKAEEELEKIRRKERTDLENAEKDRDTFKEQAETLSSENTTLKVKVALFESGALNSLKDPSDAERYLTFSDFVGDDGEVKSDELKKKLDALKKDKGYLFRGDDDEDEASGQPSGSKPKSKKQSQESTDEALRAKFPALSGR